MTGAGNGFGMVSAPAYGEQGAMECSISNGSFAPELCTRTYGWKTAVELTATPSTGSTFAGWSGACSGTGRTCKVMMTQARSVRATFNGAGTPSFTLTVAGGGDGSGTVTSQSGLSPAISCTVTDGGAVGSGCSAGYPQGTSVTLTAATSSGSTFTGWSGSCTGTGSCSLSMTANRSVTAGFDAPLGIEATEGSWAAAQSTSPVTAIHLSQLPNGKALLWGHAGEPQLWNGPGQALTEIQNPNCLNSNNCDLFCSGHAFLADGRLLVAGGHDEFLGDNNGVTQTSLFNGSSWQASGPMAHRRWYPTLVTLADGQVVSISGNREPGLTVTTVERYNPATGTWSELTSTTGTNVPLYPRAFVEPKNGHVFVAGDGTPRFLNPTGSGAWTTGSARVVADRGYGSALMLDSKVYYIGGGGSTGCPGNLPKASVEMIDLAAAAPVWSQVSTMTIGRRQTVATILADGNLLVTGGTSMCGFSNENGAVYAAEIWDPAGTSSTWQRVANARVVRTYHSTATLLPDGRVLSAGSGEGANVAIPKQYEIYSPPYLFKGARPTFTPVAGGALHYGQSFTITTPNASLIRKVLLIRLASSTHAMDMGQRLNTLVYTVAAGGTSLTVTAPAAGKIAPPGPYYLFIVNDKGVPSVAQTILLSQ